MDGAPPRGHAVDQLPFIGKLQPDPLRAYHRKKFLRGGGRIRVPNRLPVARLQLLPTIAHGVCSACLIVDIMLSTRSDCASAVG